jgi:POT family proton-dependent oligopeptide transporter
VGPLICGGIGHLYGLRYGFSAAGVGMLIAIVIFLRGQEHLSAHTGPPAPEALRRRVLPGLTLERAIYLCGVAAVLVLWQSFQFHAVIAGVVLWVAAGIALAVLYYTLFRCQPAERDRMIVVMTLLGFAVAWAALNMQMFGSMVLFADRLVDRTAFGLEVAASQLQGVPSIFVILLAPIASVLWPWLAARGRDPSIPVKISLGIGLTGLSFFVPWLAVALAGDEARVPLVALLATYFVMIAGEVCFSPIAMSMVSRLSPKRITAMMMGVFYLTQAVGSIVAGELAARYTVVERTAEGALVDSSEALNTYVSAFASFGAVTLVAAVALYLLSPSLRRRMG